MARSYEVPQSRVFIDAYDVDARLLRLGGLTRIPLIEAVLRGDNARRNTGRLELPRQKLHSRANASLRASRRLLTSYVNKPKELIC